MITKLFSFLKPKPSANLVPRTTPFTDARVSSASTSMVSNRVAPSSDSSDPRPQSNVNLAASVSSYSIQYAYDRYTRIPQPVLKGLKIKSQKNELQNPHKLGALASKYHEIDNEDQKNAGFNQSNESRHQIENTQKKQIKSATPKNVHSHPAYALISNAVECFESTDVQYQYLLTSSRLSDLSFCAENWNLIVGIYNEKAKHNKTNSLKECLQELIKNKADEKNKSPFKDRTKNHLNIDNIKYLNSMEQDDWMNIMDQLLNEIAVCLHPLRNRVSSPVLLNNINIQLKEIFKKHDVFQPIRKRHPITTNQNADDRTHLTLYNSVQVNAATGFFKKRSSPHIFSQLNPALSLKKSSLNQPIQSAQKIKMLPSLNIPERNEDLVRNQAGYTYVNLGKKSREIFRDVLIRNIDDRGYLGDLPKDMLRQSYEIKTTEGKSLFNSTLVQASELKEKNKYAALEEMKHLLSSRAFNRLSELACQNLITFLLNFRANLIQTDSKIEALPDLAPLELGNQINWKSDITINPDTKSASVKLIAQNTDPAANLAHLKELIAYIYPEDSPEAAIALQFFKGEICFNIDESGQVNITKVEVDLQDRGQPKMDLKNISDDYDSDSSSASYHSAQSDLSGNSISSYHSARSELFRFNTFDHLNECLTENLSHIIIKNNDGTSEINFIHMAELFKKDLGLNFNALDVLSFIFILVHRLQISEINQDSLTALKEKVISGLINCLLPEYKERLDLVISGTLLDTMAEVIRTTDSGEEIDAERHVAKELLSIATLLAAKEKDAISNPNLVYGLTHLQSPTIIVSDERKSEICSVLAMLNSHMEHNNESQ